MKKTRVLPLSQDKLLRIWKVYTELCKISLGAKLEARIKRVLQAGNLALLITEWSLNGTEPDGRIINLTGRGTVVLRRESDDTWLMVIENPWGTD
jgi:ketosteroid isomerase-like protein